MKFGLYSARTYEECQQPFAYRGEIEAKDLTSARRKVDKEKDIYVKMLRFEGRCVAYRIGYERWQIVRY
jgi:hypothetical protein